VFEARYKGSDSAYAQKILAHMGAIPGAHSVGGMAWTLGMHNAVVSRVAAELAKKGQLVKIQRGVFVLAEEVAEPLVPLEIPPTAFEDDEPSAFTGEEIPDQEIEEAAQVKSALAERVMAPKHHLFQ
jgi:hypothetical protein